MPYFPTLVFDSGEVRAVDVEAKLRFGVVLVAFPFDGTLPPEIRAEVVACQATTRSPGFRPPG